MSPDRNRKENSKRKRKKFQSLLRDLEGVDWRILRLFPSMDFERQTDGQVSKGIKTALRILLVAAEDGYVNEYGLIKYGVGGDSRHKLLQRLCDLRMLARSEFESKKGGQKFEYRLSGKGLLLCAAFPRVFKSDQYVSLIKEYVTNKSLANTMLFLYHRPAGKNSNPLLEALHRAFDSASNLELLVDEKIAERLLQADESATADHAEILVFSHLPEIADMLARASDEVIVGLSQAISEVIRQAHTEPANFKFAVSLVGELRQILRSPDTHILLMTPNGFARFVVIGRESFQSQLGNLATYADLVRVFPEQGRLFFAEFRRRLRQESLLRIAGLEKKSLKRAI